VNPDSDVPLRRLQSAANRSRYLGDLLRGSEFWIRFDRGDLEGALRISDGFLARYPQNRLARQMRGDALLRKGKPEEARQVYEALLAEYSGMAPSASTVPLGYFCAIGNLARIYSTLGLKTGLAGKMEEWKKVEKLGLSPWLPPSLKKEVALLPKPG
jgi:tetratricopeptide (TPR) repeat protein